MPTIRCLRCAPQSGTLKYLYGITEEAPEGENLQAQASQAHEGESPQEAFALQVVTAPRASDFLGPRLEFAPSGRVGELPDLKLPVRLGGMTLPRQWSVLSVHVLSLSAVCVFATATVSVRPSTAATPPAAKPARALPVKRGAALDDSNRATPAADLTLETHGATQSRCASQFRRGRSFGRKRRSSTPRSRFTKKS